MQKSLKIMMLIAAIAAASIGAGEAFAENDINSEDTQTVQLIAMGSTVVGALVAVGAKAFNLPAGQNFSIKKALSAIITAVTTSFTLVNLGLVPTETAGMTMFGIVIMYFILGYGTDRGLSRLDK